MALRLVEQKSCFQEDIVDNGESLQVHYVVKKTPFQVTLGLFKETRFDFKTGRLELELVYDNAERKTVITPDGSAAVEFVAHPSVDGKQCSIDIRAHMLTTQANGHRFIVLFTLSPKTGTNTPLTLESNPLVVVSKQQQIRNKEAEREREREPHNARAKKRVRTEDVFGLLNDIMEQQRLQTAQLTALGQGGHSSHVVVSDVPTRRVVKQEPAAQLSLEDALAAFMTAYRREALSSGANRLEKLRQVMQRQDADTQRELRDIGFALTSQESSSGELNNFDADSHYSLAHKSAMVYDESPSHGYETAHSPFNNEDVDMSDAALDAVEPNYDSWTPLGPLCASSNYH